jgi:5-methylcytosine-specific restriction endonuclease McrA
MASGWIKAKDRKAALERANYTCKYCKKVCKPATQKGFSRAEQAQWMKMFYADFATLDHLIPRSVRPDLMLNEHNLHVACNACNSSKKATDLETWCARKGFDSAAIRAEIDSDLAQITA